VDTYWRDYVGRFGGDQFYWYQPKGLAVNPDSLVTMQRKLRVLARCIGQPWRQVQQRCWRAWRKAGLYEPRSGAPLDPTAIVRMNKVVFDSLGLAWLTDDSIVELTEAGSAYLHAAKKRLPSLVSDQLRRYLYPNPMVGIRDPEAGLCPYMAFLAVLTHFPDGIPLECYELFLTKMRREDEVPDVVERIQRYLRMGDRERKDLVVRLETLPLMRDGRISLVGRRDSLIHTIRLNAPYLLALLKTPGLIATRNAKYVIPRERHAEVESMVQQHITNECYIHFATPEDWMAFYGDLTRRATFEEALAYYSARGDIDRSLESFERARASGRLPPEIASLEKTQFRRLKVLEKTLEDFLEFNLDCIESGLVFVARQYRTSTGPLDILARDSQKRWVVLELKRGRAAEKVVGQLQRHRAFVIRERAKGAPKRVRGIVVAPAPDGRLVEAVEGAMPAPIEVVEFLVQGKAKRLFPSAK
jgi:hypothetical protein